MCKIFQLICSIQLGGAEVVAFNLSEFCKTDDSQNFEFIIVELHQTRDNYSIEKKHDLRNKNIRILSLCGYSKSIALLIGPFILTYHLLKEKPNIIHSHTDLPDLLLSNTKRIFSFLHIKFPKIVRTIHNTVLWPTHRILGKYAETAFIDDWVVGVSDGALESYRNLRIKNNLSVSVHQRIIYNGCIIPNIKNHPFKIANNKINIAFCGRLEEQKGIDILIARINEINCKFSDNFLFHIIGSGTFSNEVLKLSKENNNVLVYDSVPNIADKLYAFDFLIIPSRFEGLVLISIEASFSKVPVIATFAPGLSETLPTNWPLMFNLANKDELLIIFDKILKHDFDLESLKNQAYLFVANKFSHSNMINAYTKLYLQINE